MSAGTKVIQYEQVGVQLNCQADRLTLTNIQRYPHDLSANRLGESSYFDPVLSRYALCCLGGYRLWDE